MQWYVQKHPASDKRSEKLKRWSYPISVQCICSKKNGGVGGGVVSGINMSHLSVSVSIISVRDMGGSAVVSHLITIIVILCFDVM